MSIQDPTDRQPSATPGERPRLPEPWWWDEESQHIVDNDDHAFSLLDAEMLGFDDGRGRVFAIPLVCIEALIGRRIAAAPARLGEPAEFCEKCGAPFGYQADAPAGAPTWGCTRCGATFLARASASPGERPVDVEARLRAEIADLEETSTDAAKKLIPLLAGHRDGFGVDDLGPFYVIRKPTDHPNYKWRHDAALDHVVDAIVERYAGSAPGERVPGGGPPPGWSDLGNGRCYYTIPECAVTYAEAWGVATAPAVSPPLRDELKPPPGWRRQNPLGDRPRWMRCDGYTSSLAEAWDIYESEHAAAPSTREGPGEDPRGHFLRELASEFFHGTTFDDLIAASPNKPASVVIADELYRRAAAFGGVAGR